MLSVHNHYLGEVVSLNQNLCWISDCRKNSANSTSFKTYWIFCWL